MTAQSKSALQDAPLSSGLVTMVNVHDEKGRAENDYVLPRNVENMEKCPPSAFTKYSEQAHYEELPDFSSNQDYAIIHKERNVAKVHVSSESMNSVPDSKAPDLPERRQSGENRSVVYVSA